MTLIFQQEIDIHMGVQLMPYNNNLVKESPKYTITSYFLSMWRSFMTEVLLITDVNTGQQKLKVVITEKKVMRMWKCA